MDHEPRRGTFQGWPGYGTLVALNNPDKLPRWTHSGLLHCKIELLFQLSRPSGWVSQTRQIDQLTTFEKVAMKSSFDEGAAVQRRQLR